MGGLDWITLWRYLAATHLAFSWKHNLLSDYIKIPLKKGVFLGLKHYPQYIGF